MLLRIQFPTKNSVSTHVCLSWSGARGLEKLPCFKYYNVAKWENRLTSGLNAAQNTDYVEKSFKLKLLRIQFPTKNPVSTHVYLPWSGVRGFERLPCLKYYNLLKSGKQIELNHCWSVAGVGYKSWVQPVDHRWLSGIRLDV